MFKEIESKDHELVLKCAFDIVDNLRRSYVVPTEHIYMIKSFIEDCVENLIFNIREELIRGVVTKSLINDRKIKDISQLCMNEISYTNEDFPINYISIETMMVEKFRKICAVVYEE